MSREEVDRILKEDLTSVDNTLNKKMQSIDQITGILAQKSHFLAQFQLLLQKELKVPKPQESSQKANANLTSQDEEIHNQIFKPQQTMKQIDSSKLIFDNQSVLIEEKNIQYKEDKQVNQLAQLKQKYRNLQLVLMEIIKDISRTRQYVSSQVVILKDYHQKQKKQIITDIQYIVQNIVQTMKDNFSKQLTNLAHQNQKLKQQIKQLRKPQQNILKQLTFSQILSPQNLNFTVTQKFRDIYQPSNNQDTLDLADQNIFKIDTIPIRSHKWTTNSVISQQNCSQINNTYRPYQQTSLKHKNNTEQIKLSSVKAISIGVPPVNHGFGVLKSGSTTIYRGMWSNGKFQGKGKLSWDNYCYQGQFKMGVFEGFGKIQIQDRTYIGKFANNRANGEGTIEQEGLRISGLWKQNQLIMRY